MVKDRIFIIQHVSSVPSYRYENKNNFSALGIIKKMSEKRAEELPGMSSLLINKFCEIRQF